MLKIIELHLFSLPHHFMTAKGQLIIHTTRHVLSLFYSRVNHSCARFRALHRSMNTLNIHAITSSKCVKPYHPNRILRCVGRARVLLQSSTRFPPANYQQIFRPRAPSPSPASTPSQTSHRTLLLLLFRPSTASTNYMIFRNRFNFTHTDTTTRS